MQTLYNFFKSTNRKINTYYNEGNSLKIFYWRIKIMTIVLGIIAILAIYGFVQSARKDKLKYEYKKAKMQRKIDNLNNDKKD